MTTVVETYNNMLHDPRLTAEWGFSCYIEEARMLFDTGGDGRILLENMRKLGIEPRDVEALVLSHDHWDHNGGLSALFEAGASPVAYVLRAFSDETLDIVERHATPVFVDRWTEITDTIFTTGPLGDVIIEQSLAIASRGGLFIITGCAHPHIGAILRYAASKGDVWGAMGGFHTVSAEDIEALTSLSYVSASHCTQGLEAIIETIPETYIPGGAGKVHML
ncbi:MAG: MBL fold metallo-hydrolase [Methanomicrobiaceae archaeon]|nr:MBL fold metallo-hydrolase [Methanomicrobiaceae archaeon]